MTTDQPISTPRRRRRWLWLLAAVVVLLLLVLTPPLLNVNRLRRRITATISQSLGRPVAIDNVTLTVLPIPCFTLQNFVVSEDPSFGDEPVIRANTVRATLRISSLWRRHVEIGTIRFEDPSVNLVRRPDGLWNLETILLHASQTEAAPTSQSKPGDAPRFPYIEAVGARVNIKSATEKLPFSLTEADFALWLPSPQQWRFRMDARPTRTDVPVSDTGTLHIDATLDRAAHIADVPITLEATWAHAPLGEASRMLTGADAGWRGTIELRTSLHGTLGSADLTTTTMLRSLRRADFIPARALDLDIRCDATLAATTALITKPSCALSNAPHRLLNLGETNVPSPTLLSLTADSLNLTGLHPENLRLMSPGMPADWLLDLARLFSQRLPPDERPVGTIIANFQFDHRNATGSAQASLPLTPPDPATPDPATPNPATANPAPPLSILTKTTVAPLPPSVYATLLAQGDQFTLVPLPLILHGKPLPLTLAATVSLTGYHYTLTGTATPSDIADLRALAPPLTDNLDPLLPPADTDTATGPEQPIHLNLECTRPWTQPQLCTTQKPPTPPRTKPHHKIKH